MKGVPSKSAHAGTSWSRSRTASIHQMPPGMEPGPAGEVRVGSAHRRRRCRPPTDAVQMYPCYAFEAHIVYVEIDPDTGKPSLKQVRLRPRLRRDDQSRHRARHDLRRHRARHRRGAVREVRLHRGRPARQRHVHGLPHSERDGGARRSASSTTARPRRSPPSARRARARPATSARPRPSPMRSTTRSIRSGRRSTRCRCPISRCGKRLAAAQKKPA